MARVSIQEISAVVRKVESEAAVFDVQKMASANATRGKVVATFSSASEASQFSTAADEGREWSDPWHRVVRRVI